MIRYFVGVPGSGKTTLACKLLRQAQRYEINRVKRFRPLRPFYKFFHKSKYQYLFANFNTSLANQIDYSVLTSQRPPDYSYLILDESGIEFNSRAFKSTSPQVIEFFKKHRHHHINVDLFSQTWDDTDKQIRDLAEEVWLLRKLGPITFARCVYKKIGIDDVTKKLEYQHYWKSLLWTLVPFMPKQIIFCWRRKYYKYFDSYEPLERPVYCPPDTFGIINNPHLT